MTSVSLIPYSYFLTHRVLTRFLFGMVALLSVATTASAATIAVLGDSLSAGYGLAQHQSWVSQMGSQLAPKHRVINASQSGETSAGGLTRLPDLLKTHRPNIVILALGANDGLRGLPLDTLEHNLSRMTQLARQSGAQVLLVGMDLPPNYGAPYTQRFRHVFVHVAKKENVPLIPLLVAGFERDLSRFQADGLHPTADAQPIIMRTVLEKLHPMLSNAP